MLSVITDLELLADIGVLRRRSLQNSHKAESRSAGVAAELADSAPQLKPRSLVAAPKLQRVI